MCNYTIDIHPEYHLPYRNRADAYFALEVAFYSKLLTLITLKIINCYEELGEYERALINYTNAIEITEDKKAYYYTDVLIFIKIGMRKKKRLMITIWLYQFHQSIHGL